MEIKSIAEDLPYKIKDINLADSGRDAISISEKENARFNGYQIQIWS